MIIFAKKNNNIMEFIVLKRKIYETYLSNDDEGVDIYSESSTVEFKGSKSECKTFVSDLENKLVYLKDLTNSYSNDEYGGDRVFSIRAKSKAEKWLKKTQKVYANTIIEKEVNEALTVSKMYNNNLYRFNEIIENKIENIKGEYFIIEAIHKKIS